MNINKLWEKKPIKNKFLSASMLTTICALLLVSFVFFVNEFIDLRKGYQKELETLSKTISNSIVTSLLFNDRMTGHQILSNLSSISNIMYASVYNNKEKIFAEYKRSGEKLTPQVNLNKQQGLNFGLRYVEFYYRIPFEDKQIGTIYIKSDLSRFYGKIITFILTIMVAMLLSVIFSYLLLNKLQSYIIAPINNLANVMDLVSRQRDYSKRAEIASKDEIGYLAMVFNEMLETIQIHSLELEKYRKHLEDLVRKRTEELIEKNRELEKELQERKKLEQQLIQSQKMEAIGTLAGGVAHDFNNLLTVVLGYGELLKQRLKDDGILHRYIDNIITSAEKGKRLTEGLLAFSRKQMSIPKPINLNDAVKDIEKILKRLIGEDIELKTKLNEREIIINGDYGQIEQILINLITNARDAMPKGGEITVETYTYDIDEGFISKYGYGKKGSYGVLKVSDTGSGMEKKVIDRIFEPFFTTKEVGKGTGLGLSVVYGIVKQNKGFINVESEINKGSTFTIYFPIIEESATEKEKELSEIHVEYGRGETILVAEDDDSLRGLIKTVLEQFKYNVIVASDGNEAIKVFQERKDNIDLVILDVIMPKVNGKEAYDYIKGLKPEIPAIFISGYTSDFLSSREIALENLEFIQKPILPQELIKRVRNILG